MFMNKPLILVVEDDTAIRKLITTTLETQGYLYHTGETGEASIFEKTPQSQNIFEPISVSNTGCLSVPDDSRPI